MSRLLLQLALILLLPRLLHYTVVQHLYQPRAVSEMISGLLLGPSFLGRIPGWMPNLFPDFSMPILKVLSMLGSAFFLFIVGLGIDLRVLKTEWPLVFGSVALSACFSVMFAVPLTLLFWSPNGEASYTTGTFSESMMFLAAIIGITATGLLARILSDRGILAKRLGDVTMATTAVNAMYHSLLFASALAMYGVSYTWTPPDPLPPGKTTPLDAGSREDPIYIILLFSGFVLFLLLPVRWLWIQLALRAQRKKKLDMFVVWLALFSLLACGYITQAATLAARLGGFAFGLFAIPRIGTFAQELRRFFETPIVLIFIPIFYAWNGIRVDFFLLSGRDVACAFLLWGISFAVKFSAMYMLACANSLQGFKGAFFGIAHATKGFAGAIICNVALEVGFISKRYFALVMLFSVLSTVTTTPLIRLIQLIETRFKQRPDGHQNLGKQSLHYHILLIASSLAAAKPITQLAAEIASAHPPHLVTVTALKRISTEDMDDSFSAMYLENGTFAELYQDPILAACLDAWRAGRNHPQMTLKALTMPDSLNDVLAYVHGEGVTGHSLDDDLPENSREPFQGVVIDYDRSQINLIESLLMSKRIDTFVMFNPAELCPQRVLLLLGSSDFERQNEGLCIQLACMFYRRRSGVTLALWKHTPSQDNPLPPFGQGCFSDIDAEHLEFEGDLPTVLAAVSEPEPIMQHELIIAPSIITQRTNTATLGFLSATNFLGLPAEKHAFDVLAAAGTSIILVSARESSQTIQESEEDTTDAELPGGNSQYIDG